MEIIHVLQKAPPTLLDGPTKKETSLVLLIIRLTGQIRLLQDVYNKHWEYNRADPHLQSLLRNTSMYPQADDHEVVNDYGTKWSYWTDATKGRSGFPNVVKAGINAFFDLSHIDRSKVEPNQSYRSFHRGKDLDLFILDMHSYRSRNDIDDTPGTNKTLLGKDQLHWLEQDLLNSTATWKLLTCQLQSQIALTNN